MFHHFRYFRWCFYDLCFSNVWLCFRLWLVNCWSPLSVNSSSTHLMCTYDFESSIFLQPYIGYVYVPHHYELIPFFLTLLFCYFITFLFKKKNEEAFWFSIFRVFRYLQPLALCLLLHVEGIGKICKQKYCAPIPINIPIEIRQFSVSYITWNGNLQKT